MVSLSFIWFAASAGALSLLTPCVFPMVPITVSYFVQHGGESRGTALRNALIFSLGIISTFTALGLALAIFVGATGINRFASNPWVNMFIAAVFVAFAMSLLGVFTIRLPYALINRLDATTRRSASHGVVGALLMGLMFTLTSFTCTAPFVGTLLVAAARGSWQQPFVGMLVYSTVFAIPFFVLALVPQWMNQLPKSGGWLNSVKVVMGLLEIAAAFKFIANADLIWHWNVFTHDVVLAVWIAVALLIVLYLFGGVHFAHDVRPVHLGAGRAFAAAGFGAIALWLATGLSGRGLGELESFLPPAGGAQTAGVAAPSPTRLQWQLNDLPGALAAARASDKRVFIDFTGYTCTNCRWMEANMFTRPEIKKALARFQLARLFTDGEGEMYEQQQELQQRQFGTIALPLYAIVDGTGKTVAISPGLTRDPVAFLAFLNQGLSRE